MPHPHVVRDLYLMEMLGRLTIILHRATAIRAPGMRIADYAVRFQLLAIAKVFTEQLS